MTDSFSVPVDPSRQGEPMGEPTSDRPVEHWPVFIAGGGPAGLTAAYQLLKINPELRALVVEAGDRVGGISRTEEHNGYRFDIGGHRFYTKLTEVEALWHEVLGDELIKRPRLSRIYYRGKYYRYPLKAVNALGNLGLREAIHILLSYAKWKVRPHKEEENLEQWVVNRFGGRLYWHFFRTYTEKVWGMPCTEIRADWAAQRIKTLSLSKAVINALTGHNTTVSMIDSFLYPRLGPGQMWEAFADRVDDRGGEVRLHTRAVGFKREGTRIIEAEIEDENGQRSRVRADHFLSTLPLPELVRSMDPPAPPEVLEAANGLRFRDFLIVTLVLNRADPFPDNWIYIHSPDVKVGRIQNFRAWSEDMVPNPDHASIGMEYFCSIGDDLWDMSNEDLIVLARQELAQLGLASEDSVLDGKVIRVPKAYPVYDADYQQHVNTIRDWLLTLDNLQSAGRNGMHRYNNQDHSMFAGMLAARNMDGENHDIWNLNVERSYYEDFSVSRARLKAVEESGETSDAAGRNSAGFEAPGPAPAEKEKALSS